MWFDKQLIFVGLEINSREEVLTFLGSQLEDGGYVTNNFTESVIEREKAFPTGLPTIPYGIAIPHTDGDKVMQSKVVFATLRQPVRFRQMGNAAKEIEVSLVSMMALKTAHDHTSMLQKMMEIFQNESLVYQLKQMKKEESIVKLLEST